MSARTHKTLDAADYSPPSGSGPLIGIRPSKILAVVFIAALISLIYFLITSTTIQIDTKPVESRVQINGFHIPVGNRFIVRTGPLNVSAEHDGYQQLDAELEISKLTENSFQFELVPLPGKLLIDLQPASIQADVFVSGILTGVAPGLIENVPAGTQTVMVDAPLYRAESFTLDILGQEQIQELAVSLEPAFAQVKLETEPSGASVQIDGVNYGETPLSYPLEEGTRTIQIELAGYKTLAQQLSIQPSVNLSELFVLEPNDARLSINSNPQGAAVTLDTEFLGQTPLKMEVAPGDRDLRLFLAGYQPASRRISLSSDQESEVDVSLQIQTAPVQISVFPNDAEIYVDGAKVASGSTTLQLATKSSVIEVKRRGYATYSTEIIPTTGATQVVSARLLTLEEAKWANIPTEYSIPNGYRLKLFRDPGMVQLGSPRREAGRRANEFQFTVNLERAFYAGLTEVTNEQFRQYDPNHSSRNFEGLSLDGSDQPVVGITWQQAALFCNWLSEQEGLEPFYTIERGFVAGQNSSSTGYRLLTEAEWTWLATAGFPEQPIYPWGASSSPTELFGNVADESIADKIGFTQENYNDRYPVSSKVATFPANALGIYDLGGNVAEWVHDWYEASAISESSITEDYMGPDIGEFHVIRGASWARGYLPQLRLAYRDYDAEGRNDVGFRIGRYAQ